MGVLFDYFAADSEAQAAMVIDWAGGPRGPGEPSSPTLRRGLFRRRSAADTDGEQPVPSFDVVPLSGVDPVVQMGTLEELLTGKPYDEIVEGERSGHVVAERDGGEQLVVALTDGLMSALAVAGDDRLIEVAVPWAETEEFFGATTPEDLVVMLRKLAGLAQRARANNRQLYCWVCV